MKGVGENIRQIKGWGGGDGVKNVDEVSEILVNVNALCLEEGAKGTNPHFLCIGSIAQCWVEIFYGEESPILSHLIFENVFQGFAGCLLHCKAMGVHLDVGIKDEIDEARCIHPTLRSKVHVPMPRGMIDSHTHYRSE